MVSIRRRRRIGEIGNGPATRADPVEVGILHAVAGEIALNEIHQQRDRRPMDDFEGLSSEQMHRLINFPFESPEIVQFPSLLSAPPSAPIAALFGMLADAIGEDGLKPTATGNLPLKPVFAESRENTIRKMYSLRCLRRFAKFMGLIQIKPNPEDSLGRVFTLRKTPLLGDAVGFHL